MSNLTSRSFAAPDLKPLNRFTHFCYNTVMKTVSVTAHFDGEYIQLDEPLELEPNAKLMVTVLSTQDSERSAWQQVSARGLANAYGEDEEEYALSDIKVSNPAYERR